MNQVQVDIYERISKPLSVCFVEMIIAEVDRQHLSIEIGYTHSSVFLDYSRGEGNILQLYRDLEEQLTSPNFRILREKDQPEDLPRIKKEKGMC